MLNKAKIGRAFRWIERFMYRFAFFMSAFDVVSVCGEHREWGAAFLAVTLTLFAYPTVEQLVTDS